MTTIQPETRISNGEIMVDKYENLAEVVRNSIKELEMYAAIDCDRCKKEHPVYMISDKGNGNHYLGYWHSNNEECKSAILHHFREDLKKGLWQ